MNFKLLWMITTIINLVYCMVIYEDLLAKSDQVKITGENVFKVVIIVFCMIPVLQWLVTFQCLANMLIWVINRFVKDEEE